MHLRRLTRFRRSRAILVTGLAMCLLASCATVIDGRIDSSGAPPAPNAHLDVKGATGTGFDVVAQNALSDIMAFWKNEFPKVSGGKALGPLRGGLYSVDGQQVATSKKAPTYAKQNKCIGQDPSFIIDNGAFCLSDDSIAWDRAPNHLFAQLADKYGDFMVALIFAHEFGHSISYQLGVFNNTNLKTIDTESQADCAAGAWAASALKGQDPHFPDITAQKLDDALEGYLNGRDSTPDTPQDISHGNGFDRLSALADGIDKGVTYCFSKDYFTSRSFTERPFAPGEAEMGDNSPLSTILTSDPKNAFVADLNRYWSSAAQTINKTFQPVKFAEASHPPCSGDSIKFGYCASTNTVYYDTTFATHVYYSLPTVTANQTTGDVKILDNQAADFALGVMLSIGWGMAVRHQLFNRGADGAAALTSAICYSGAYAKDINVPPNTPGKGIILSPSDLDEAVSSMLDDVGQSDSFGSRGTSGLDRIQAFVKGYHGGLSVC